MDKTSAREALSFAVYNAKTGIMFIKAETKKDKDGNTNARVPKHRMEK